MRIVGNGKVIAALERAFADGRMAQSYLFCGPSAVGKFLAARGLAEKLVRTDRDQTNPDLVIVEPEKEEKDGVIKEREIRLEAIKELQRLSGLTSFSGGYRVAIIREADRLNQSAQNALLKILEEPPAKTLFILVCEDERSLLPTIVSRCQIRRFGVVPDDELEQLLPAGISQRQELLFWSFGRPGLLLELINDPARLDERRAAERELRALATADGNDRIDLAENLSKNTPALLEKFNLWIILLRDSILNRGSGSPVADPARALGLIEAIDRARETISGTNSNTRLVLENLFLSF